jgi:lipopolysaccharide transport system ATP-binding protein
LVAIALYNSMGFQITDLANLVSSESVWINYNGNKVVVKCKIHKLPLNEGQYRFNLYAKLNEDVIDAIEYAGSFNVTSGDYFGTGKLPSPNQGNILFEQTWTIG